MLLFKRESYIERIDGQGTVFFLQSSDLNEENALSSVPERVWLRYTTQESA
jgi:hypothetical protein